MQKELQNKIQQLYDTRDQIIEYCTKNNIRCNIQLAMQIDGDCSYPFKDNSNEIKKKYENNQSIF